MPTLEEETAQLAQRIGQEIHTIQGLIDALTSQVQALEAGGGGASTYAELTDAATVDLPAINTPLITALNLKLSTTAAAAAYQPLAANLTSWAAIAPASKASLVGADFTGPVTVTSTGASTIEGVTFEGGGVTGATINLFLNAIEGTKAQFDTAVTDGDFMFQGDNAATATALTTGNKTITGTIGVSGAASIDTASTGGIALTTGGLAMPVIGGGFSGFWSTWTGSANTGDQLSLVAATINLTGNAVITGKITGTEQASPPAAPAANGYVLYAEDNGSGKTRLMVRFASGAAQQVAIEP